MRTMADGAVNAMQAALNFMNAAVPQGEKPTRAAAMEVAQVYATLAVAFALQDLTAAVRETGQATNERLGR